MTVLRALAVFLLGTSMAAAQARIPGSELPGRERYRFVDPPGAQLMQPSPPSTVLPYGARRLDCPRGPGERKSHWRKRCITAR